MVSGMGKGVNRLIEIVSGWDGVEAGPHRFGGSEFTLGKVEIGHVHRFGLVDVPFTQRVREQLVAEGKADPHHVLPDSGWISYTMRSAGDLEGAVWLMRLSYLHKRMARSRQNGDERAALAHQAADLHLSRELKERTGLAAGR